MKPNIEKLKGLFEDKSKFALIFPLIKNLNENQIAEFSKNSSLNLEFEFKGQKESVELDEECLLVQVEISNKGNAKEIVAGNNLFVYSLHTEID